MMTVEVESKPARKNPSDKLHSKASELGFKCDRQKGGQYKSNGYLMEHPELGLSVLVTSIAEGMNFLAFFEFTKKQFPKYIAARAAIKQLN